MLGAATKTLGTQGNFLGAKATGPLLGYSLVLAIPFLVVKLKSTFIFAVAYMYILYFQISFSILQMLQQTLHTK